MNIGMGLILLGGILAVASSFTKIPVWVAVLSISLGLLINGLR